MSSQDLVRYSEVPANLSEKLTYAEQFAAAGLFSDMKSAAACLVKIQAGAELGFPPFASMNGIAIIQGKPTLGGAMYAALVESSPDHELELVYSTPEGASGRFWSRSKRSGQWVQKGEFTFTLTDAKRMGLAGKDNWLKSPQQMCYWRMIANGARMFFPALCAGIYLPDELGANVSEQGGVIDVESHPVEASPQATERAPLTVVEGGQEADPGTEEIRLKERRLSLWNTWRGNFKTEALGAILGREVKSPGATFKTLSMDEMNAVERFITTGEMPVAVQLQAITTAIAEHFVDPFEDEPTAPVETPAEATP